MHYTAAPYMHDVLPTEPSKDGWLHVARWKAVERLFRETCRTFGYHEIRTPIMESTELFTRSIGQGTDIVSKEMFTFEDRGGRSMTLRPEGTAPVIRACVEHNLVTEGQVTKLCYVSTIYRYERGQRGRYREHQQTGVEALGSQDPALDAEIISLALEFYRRIGLCNLELRLNSVGCPACRPSYRQALIDYATPLADRMSEDNRTRLAVNPLRMLDSKDPRDRELLENAPSLSDHLCPECAEHFGRLQELLKSIGVRFCLDPHLVRGFDYYTKTAFEIVSPELGAQNVVGGGGRYDGLYEEIGGPHTPGIGFGIGTERCLIVLDQLGINLPIEDGAPDVFVAAPTPETRPIATMLVHSLRVAGIASDMDYCGKSLKAQMRQANRLGAHYVAILGADEIARGAASVKDLRGDGGQRELPLADIADAVRPTA